MIRNNLKIAWRSIRKAKALSMIHIFGLAIALGVAILLFLTARFELSYDRFHKDVDRIALLYSKSQPERGVQYNTAMAAPLTPLIKDEIPNIESASRISNFNTLLRNGDKELESSNKYVDPDFLSILTYPILQGDVHALKGKDKIVLDEAMAMRLFGSKEVLGKQLEVNIQGKWEPRTVSAVLASPPKNSSLQFNSLMNFQQKPNYETEKGRWDIINHDVIIKLKSGKVDDVAFGKAVKSFTNQYFKETIDNLKRDGATADKDGSYFSLHLMPIADFHLSDLGIANGPSASFPWILIGIAALIVFIACSNFINLTLANSMMRSREISTRKTLGATLNQLMRQLWLEALLLCLIALAFGIIIAWLALPEYNAIMNYRLSLAQLLIPKNLIIFTAVFLLITFLAAGYPAWKVARSSSIQSLKAHASIKSSRLRNVLTVLQFSIAILLIVSTIVISSQLNYLANRPLGFNKTEVISIPIGNGINHEDALYRMRTALEQEPWVKSVSAADINMGLGNDGSTRKSVFGFNQENKEYSTNYMRIDYDYLKTLDIKLLAGRDFDRNFATDSNAVILNKQMAESMGGINKVLGSQINLNGKSLVIGIIDDFNFQDLRKKVEPLSLSINPNVFSIEYIFVRVETNNLQESLQKLEQTWKQVNPKATIQASFLDENTQNMYQDDRRFSMIVIVGTGIAILIACMGLFALAILTINRRVKEIGIRKVLGSSVGSLIILLSKDFMKLVFIAFLIAAPIAWFLMNSWLKVYAYRINVSFWMFALAACIAVFIAWSTIAWQTLRAARANPVDSLRDE